MNGIEIRGVSKSFAGLRALDDITLTLGEGMIYGLLGRNGAGKSTLLNLITNRLFPDEGEIFINGEPAAENDRAQSLVYLMGEKDYYPDAMRVRDVFRWTGNFYGGFDLERAGEFCELFGLDQTKKIQQLSTGYRSIYKIITALCVDVPYVLLDEPVLGLDANHRELFYKLLIEQYAAEPRTFVLSTHLIEEIAALIEQIVVIKNGRIIRDESCESLLASGYTVAGKAGDVDRFIEGKNVIGTDTLGGLKTAYLLGRPNRDEVPQGIELSRIDLQKLFIELTNEQGAKK
ncbi:ATP-binding cassette domain-containing protein [Feifania hominis]|uniref:ABC transporter ATP-binding protein n=1 Tax=Feifania hominis TaxID=2763660 RepID=A0A926DCR8_9FIRM|nr:ABC transporter ATP-binding protein [Feifania hominis]MBC8535436.1 ABC transporter ATP-binding protein [Feifania hominis]